MNCCSRQCQGIEAFFDDKVAQRELRSYQKRGPRKTTRLLLDAVRTRLRGKGRLLDIGGGIGAIQHELVPTTLAHATSVDASPAYLAAAQQEATRRGYAEHTTYIAGNFVDVAETVDLAHVVTLDRVICCFDDVDALVQQSAAKAEHLYALVFPRDHWLNRLMFPLINLISRLQRADFRIFLHPSQHVESLLADAGFERCFLEKTLLWQVRVFQRRVA